MSLIQIRNVPEDVHRTLKARAALEGRSLSDYMLAEAVRLASMPTPDEMIERLKRRGRSGISTKAILEARDSGRRE